MNHHKFIQCVNSENSQNGRLYPNISNPHPPKKKIISSMKAQPKQWLRHLSFKIHAVRTVFTWRHIYRHHQSSRRLRVDLSQHKRLQEEKKTLRAWPPLQVWHFAGGDAAGGMKYERWRRVAWGGGGGGATSLLGVHNTAQTSHPRASSIVLFDLDKLP